VTSSLFAARSLSDGRAAKLQVNPSVDQRRASERFGEIVMPHLADGVALARWLSGNASDADDIVQEACVRALKAIDGFRGGSGRAWLLSIVRNTAYSWLARERSPTLVMVGDLGDVEEAATGSASGGADPGPTAEAALIRRADHAAVAGALAQIALPLREVLVLREINELNYKDIAQVLNVPIGTVMSRLSRGREHLAALLSKEPG
jgi:RNA polymerase sigma factor (sigma-70 family)